MVGSETKKSLQRRFAIWKKVLTKDIFFRSFLIPPPASLKAPTMFKIIQNWPTFHFQEVFLSPQTCVGGATRSSDYGS